MVSTALLCPTVQVAMDSPFPYRKRITPETLLGYSETGKAAAIQKVFEDAYRTPLSFIILDDIERLIGECRTPSSLPLETD